MKNLASICWVRGGDEGDDLCPDCCKKRVKELKKEFPNKEFYFDGGWNLYRESDDLAYCDECLCHLGCAILREGWINTEGWTDDDLLIGTENEWVAADKRICGEEKCKHTTLHLYQNPGKLVLINGNSALV